MICRSLRNKALYGTRGLPTALREQVLARLTASNASVTWINQVRTVIELDKADERRAFGESLPAGLRLLPQDYPADRNPRPRRADGAAS